MEVIFDFNRQITLNDQAPIHSHFWQSNEKSLQFIASFSTNSIAVVLFTKVIVVTQIVATFIKVSFSYVALIISKAFITILFLFIKAIY